MIDWSAEQLLMRDGLRQFVRDKLEPRAAELEHGDLPAYDLLREMYQAFGLGEAALESYRERLAGDRPRRPRTPDEVAAVLLPLIELSRCSPGMVTALGVSTNLTAGAILKSGTRELTEPGSGSDAFGGMRSRAVRDGDGYVLNGSKTFITNGPYADLIVFICRMDDEVDGTGRPRIGSFVLDRGTHGLTQSAPLRKMGLHSSPTGEVFAQDVRVGADRLLAGGRSPRRTAPASGATPATANTPAIPAGGATAGRGSAAGGRSSAKGTFASERASIAAIALGIIERCLELSVEYARTRVQFGHPIGDYQLIQDKLAGMEVARLTVQSLLFRYIEAVSTGVGISLGEASVMKLHSARAAVSVAMEAVQLHGGNGYMSEFRVEQLARDAKVLQIYAGTDEIQTLAIARELLRP
jgi:acyl-CoA dehydrogenase